MMKEGDKVRWTTVNGFGSGVLVKEQKDGDWIVLLDNGKHVIVNERSFKNG